MNTLERDVLRTQREHETVTMVKKLEGQWDIGEIEILMLILEDTLMSRHSNYPDILILTGAHSRRELETALSHNNFERVVVEGHRNPELPFRPQFI